MHASAHHVCKLVTAHGRQSTLRQWRSLQTWLPTLIALAVALAVAAAFWVDPKVLPSYDTASGAIVTATRLPGLRAAIERWADALAFRFRGVVRRRGDVIGD